MQTRSEQMQRAEHGMLDQEWAARPATAPSSIFRNYSGSAAPSFASGPQHLPSAGPELGPVVPLQALIDVAMARSFLYRLIAQAFEDPNKETWASLSEPSTQRALDSAVRILAPLAPGLNEAGEAFRAFLIPKAFEPFLGSCLEAFGHAARGRCPLNEIEYGDIKADPLFQPHRLADLASFYRAFGLEVADDADERHDHLCLELEFMCVLAAKEAYALEHQLDSDDLSLCRNAQKRFLREHLARWTPAFARRLARMAGGNALGALANLLRVFVEAECALHGIIPGSEDLLLRPVDEAAESLCNACGPMHLPPGAMEPR